MKTTTVKSAPRSHNVNEKVTKPKAKTKSETKSILKSEHRPAPKSEHRSAPKSETKSVLKSEHSTPKSQSRSEARSEPAHGLRDLFVYELKDIYWAEKALTKAIPKMIKSATSLELVKALSDHLQETLGHVRRLEEVFSVLGEKPAAIKCEAMNGLIMEAEEVLDETENGEVCDAAIILSAQKVEHYEIATYGTLCTFARTLEEDEIAVLLGKTLDEEKNADKKLSDISENWLDNMEDDNEDSIDVLNNLLEINNDRIEGYSHASKETHERDLKKLFKSFEETSNTFREALTAEVQKLGGEPVEGTRTTGKLFRAWMDIKAAITNNDRKGILNSCEFGEDIAVQNYEDALDNDDIDSDLHQLINKQYIEIKAEHDKIKSMRDADEGTANAEPQKFIRKSTKVNYEKSTSAATEGLRDLFVYELKDLYWAEKALTKAIPKMIKNATSEDLVDALSKHLEETLGHVTRLESVFSSIGEKAVAKKCVGMTGIINEAEEVMLKTEQGEVRDAGIILSAQKVEHYEIAAYGTLRAFARTLKQYDAVDLLEDTLDEEKAADEKLSEIAEDSVNEEAVGIYENEDDTMVMSKTKRR